MNRITDFAKRCVMVPVLAGGLAFGAVVPTVSVTATSSALVLGAVIVAGQAEARPRTRHGGNRTPHRTPHAQPAPRRRDYDRHDHRRDHRRRVVRRRHVLGFLYVASLPPACTTIVVLDGVRWYFCDDVYYRPYIDGGTTIYIIKE